MSAFPLTVAGLTSGVLPAAHTCDGARVSPAVAWSGAPAEAVAFALVMSHVPGEGSTKYNWLLYDIPATATGIPENERGVGTFGNIDEGGQNYWPPCPRGAGTFAYTFTVYALSGRPDLSGYAPSQVNGAVLSAAIAPLTISSANVTLTHTNTVSR